jgi:hypothetical protein
MNRRTAGVAVGLALLVPGCTEAIPGEPQAGEILTLERPISINDQPLVQLGNIVVACVGVEGLSKPSNNEECDKKAGNLASGLERISKATGGKIPVPEITAVTIPGALAVEDIRDRCETIPFKVNAFAARILNATVTTPEVKKALSKTPESNLHIVTESPVKETCGTSARRQQAYYLRGKPNRPVVQYTGEGADRDAKTGAHERLHDWLGHVLKLTYPDGLFYAGEELKGDEKFTDDSEPGPTVMGRGDEPFINAYQQLQTGVLSSKNVETPTAPQTISLTASFNNKKPGPAETRLVGLPLRHQGIMSQSFFPNQIYWAAYDSPSEVSILVAGQGKYRNEPDQPAVIAQLQSGQEYIDKASGFRLTVMSTDEQAKLYFIPIK